MPPGDKGLADPGENNRELLIREMHKRADKDEGGKREPGKIEFPKIAFNDRTYRMPSRKPRQTWRFLETGRRIPPLCKPAEIPPGTAADIKKSRLRRHNPDKRLEKSCWINVYRGRVIRQVVLFVEIHCSKTMFIDPHDPSKIPGQTYSASAGPGSCMNSDPAPAPAAARDLQLPEGLGAGPAACPALSSPARPLAYSAIFRARPLSLEADSAICV